RDDPAWVPPLMLERLALLDKRRNPYFEHAEAEYWTACRNGLPVGRISAQIDRLVEEARGERIGHFGMFECIDDPDAAAALFEVAERWLAERGCTRVEGPFNLSINGEIGLLIDGFDTPPALMMGHARPWYRRLVEAQGYAKAKDVFAYELDLSRGPPERITRFVEASRRNPRFRLHEIDMRRYDEELETVIDIFNDAWSENWGFVPLTRAEARHMAQEIRPLIDPTCVQICSYQGQPSAMMVALYDLNALIADLGGRLLPFGWLRLIWRMKTRYPERFRVPLMGVRKAHQNTRQGAAMALLLIEAIRQGCVAKGARWGELSWILEDNHGMRDILDEIGCRIYKTYRIFGKMLG
ncbi:MAG: hypothetical protein ACE5ED_12525, partial [Rhodothalassiaceae bacterium]